MSFTREIFFLICLLLLNQEVISSNKYIDSLETELSKCKDLERKIKLLNDLSFEYRSSNINKAKVLIENAFELNKQVNNRNLLISSHLVKGIINKNLGNFEIATSEYLSALKIAEEIADSCQISNCLSNLGSVFSEQGNYLKAIEYYSKSLETEQKLNNKKNISIRLYNLGSAYEMLDSLSNAFSCYTNSLLIEEELKNNEGIYYALYGLCGINRRLGNFVQARNNIIKAIKIAENMNDISGISLCFAELGKLMLNLNKPDSAIICFHKSLDNATKIGYKNLQKDCYYSLSNIFKEIHKIDSAYFYLNRYVILNDSILNIETNSKIAELQARFDSDKKETEIELLNIEKEKQRIEINHQKSQRNYLIITFILMIFLTVTNLHRFRKKNK